MKPLDHIGVHGAETNVKRSTFLLIVVIELTLWELLRPSSTLPLTVQLTPLMISFAFFAYTALVEIVVVNEAADRDWVAFVGQNAGFESPTRVRSIRWKKNA